MNKELENELELFNFFVDDKFYHGVEDFLEDLDVYENGDEIDFDLIDDDWTCKIGFTTEESMFQLEPNVLSNILYDTFVDRYSEYAEEESEIIRALKECVDFDKLNSKIPKLHYPNGKYHTLTKQELINYCK